MRKASDLAGAAKARSTAEPPRETVTAAAAIAPAPAPASATSIPLPVAGPIGTKRSSERAPTLYMSVSKERKRQVIAYANRFGGGEQATLIDNALDYYMATLDAQNGPTDIDEWANKTA